jgi:hypothetical protein
VREARKGEGWRYGGKSFSMDGKDCVVNYE